MMYAKLDAPTPRSEPSSPVTAAAGRVSAFIPYSIRLERRPLREWRLLDVDIWSQEALASELTGNKLDGLALLVADPPCAN